jgi:hypothetical protein
VEVVKLTGEYRGRRGIIRAIDRSSHNVLVRLVESGSDRYIDWWCELREIDSTILGEYGID